MTDHAFPVPESIPSLSGLARAIMGECPLFASALSARRRLRAGRPVRGHRLYD